MHLIKLSGLNLKHSLKYILRLKYSWKRILVGIIFRRKQAEKGEEKGQRKMTGKDGGKNGLKIWWGKDGEKIWRENMVEKDGGARWLE